MDAQEIMDAARRRLQDYNDESYSDEELIQYLNDAQKDLAVTGCFQVISRTPINDDSMVTWEQIAEGVRGSELVRDGLEIERVDIGGGPLYASSLQEEIDWYNPDSGTPEGWTYFNGPALGEADTDGTILLDKKSTVNLWVFYTYSPRDIDSGTDTVVTPLEFTPALSAYVAYRCLDSEQSQGAGVLMREYELSKAMAARTFSAPENQ